MWNYLITFLAVFFTDVIYIYFLKSVQHNRPMIASFWSVVVTFTASVAVINYTTDNFALVFALLGAFFGTLVGMKIKPQITDQQSQTTKDGVVLGANNL